MKTKVINEIETLSQNLLDSIKTRKRPSPTLYDLIFFKAMKCKIAPLKEVYPCDYEYWEQRGWLNKDYYLDNASINPFKNIYAKFIERRIKNERMKNFKQ